MDRSVDKWKDKRRVIAAPLLMLSDVDGDKYHTCLLLIHSFTSDEKNI